MHYKVIATAAAIMSLTMSAFAAPHDSCRTEMGKGERIARELGLSGQQKSQLKELRKGMRDFRKDQMDKMRAVLEKSKEELLKPAPDKGVLYGYAKDMGDLRRIMAEKDADHLLTVKTILTPDQFTKLLGMNFREGGGHRPDGAHDSLHARCPHGKGPYGARRPDIDD